MSYSEVITRNDLTEILTQLGIGVSFGQMYHADWTATSSSSTPYQVTGSITLSKGKYLAIISIPVCSQETVLYFYLHSLGAKKSIVHGLSQSKYPVLFELTETTTIWVETGMSQSTTYSYLECGGLDVICLSDLKQYGTTVLDYYPVGSYYETSDSNFNPNTEWGGTWNKLTKHNIITKNATNVTLKTYASTIVTSVTLPANSKWLLLGLTVSGQATVGVTSNCQFTRASGAGDFYPFSINSVSASSGAYLIAQAYVNATTQSVINLTRYNYTSADITNAFGNIVAIPLDNYNDGKTTWHRTA